MNKMTLKINTFFRPFERTRSDQDQIYQHLQFFAELTSRIPLKILRELSSVVQLEKWNTSGYTGSIANNHFCYIYRIYSFERRP